MTQSNVPSWWKSEQPIKLPVLSKNIHLLLQILGDEHLSYAQLAGEISHYPTIAARLLYLANSCWSSPGMPIADVEQACTRLGLSVVKSVSIALVIANTFDHGRCSGFDVEHFWLSSMLVAEGASLLSQTLPAALRANVCDKTAYTAGILHIIGLLWLADNLPKETAQALQQVKIDADMALNLSLMHYTQTDYCQVGGWIAAQWHMPTVLVNALRYQDDIDFTGPSWEMALLVSAAATMVAAIIRQEEQLPAVPACERLQISLAEQEQVFRKISAKLEKTLALSRLLFG